MDIDIECPYCGESIGFEVPESFKGDCSCCKCPHSFYVEIEKGKIKTISKETQVKKPPFPVT
ncbi:hypothetical protein ACFLTY_05415 [Chloroflexota bacterium]